VLWLLELPNCILIADSQRLPIFKPQLSGYFPEMNDYSEYMGELSRVVLQRLESLQRAGLLSLPKQTGQILPEHVMRASSRPVPPIMSRFTVSPVQPAPAPRVADVPKPPSPPVRPPIATPSLAPLVSVPTNEKQATLDALQCDVAKCQICPELVRNRKRTVFGEGNPQARLAFFGEAPGAEEDLSGRPFVGASGQLLDKIIAACTLKREEVYILNTLRCRPPGNRTPTDTEVENCRPFFERQLEIIAPEFIVCLGAPAMKALFPQAKSIGSMRGRLHNYRWAQVVVTYHPSYLLRYPENKKYAWDDMKLLLQAMGIQLPSKS
jgi:uracil-DNA glycosylase